jgi:hypothetical protein
MYRLSFVCALKSQILKVYTIPKKANNKNNGKVQALPKSRTMDKRYSNLCFGHRVQGALQCDILSRALHATLDFAL